MNPAKSKHTRGKAFLVTVTGEGEGNIMNKKTSNQIVEALKSKGIHAEVCKRRKG